MLFNNFHRQSIHSSDLEGMNPLDENEIDSAQHLDFYKRQKLPEMYNEFPEAQFAPISSKFL